MDQSSVSWIYPICDVVKTLAATFLGAWSAFRFSGRREHEKTEQENYLAGQSALFSLASQVNQLLQMRKTLDHIFSIMGPLPKTKGMPSFVAPPPVDFSSLVFLLDGGTAGLVQELQIAVDQYLMTLGVITLRNRVCEEAQTKIDDYISRTSLPGVENPFIDPATIRSAMGGKLTAQIEQITTELDQALKVFIPQHTALFEKMRDALVARFREKNFISLVVVQD